MPSQSPIEAGKELMVILTPDTVVAVSRKVMETVAPGPHAVVRPFAPHAFPSIVPFLAKKAVNAEA
jgi:hypothetical protein